MDVTKPHGLNVWSETCLQTKCLVTGKEAQYVCACRLATLLQAWITAYGFKEQFDGLAVHFLVYVGSVDGSAALLALNHCFRQILSVHRNDCGLGG